MNLIHQPHDGPDNDPRSDQENNPSAWIPPVPRAIPALRETLIGSLASPWSLTYTINAIVDGNGTIVPSAPSAPGSAILLHSEEIERLNAAALYSMTADMTRLAIAAATSVSDWSVTPDDLPAEQGLIVFDHPIGQYTNPIGSVDIVACSWGRSPHCEPDDGAVWLTFWSARNTAGLTEHFAAQGEDAERVDTAIADIPPLLWDNEALLCWDAGQPEIPMQTRAVATKDISGIVAAPTTLPWIQIIRAAWVIITQPNISEVTEQQAPRPERRRAERAGRPLAPVRVVSIHRRANPDQGGTQDGDHGRKIGVRFLVGAHIRNQAYGPGRTQRRRILILPHWRGPEDGPVHHSDRVNLVDRSPQP